MAWGVKPDCRYGHGPLELSIIQPMPGDAPGMQSAFFVPAVLATKTTLTVDLGRGFSCEIWECTKCSYIEFHDADPQDNL
jgi:hypothetical protein